MKNRSPCKTPGSTRDEQKLKIIIRIRPTLNQEDPQNFVNLQGNDTLQIRRPGNHSYMKFNNILPPQCTQKDVFHLVEDSIKQFLKGINTTIFAYGQTGAGKTYSIIGNYTPNESQQNLFNFLSSKERGILSRSLEMIMNTAAKEPHCRLFVSFYQIYNEKINDLYNYTNIGLDIRESKNGEITIPDLVTVEVTKMQEAIQFLMIGLKNRATLSTQANAKSSRSHSIFQISLERQEGDQIICSSLRIVDLAGSQKFKIPSDLTPTQRQLRIQQLTSINGSLSSLGHCISALIDKSRTHIPFRNSKLTRILSDSLLGQGKMRFIICISPSMTASAQTFSTLQFANRAKRAIFDRSESKSLSIQKKRSSTDEQVSILKRDLEKQRQLRIIMEKQLNELKKQNELLRLQNSKLVGKTQDNAQGQAQRGERQGSSYSRVSYYDQNKENDFKDEILRLPIFQKNKIQPIAHNGNDTPSPRNRLQASNNASQVSQPSKSVAGNKKKAEFQKKIRKFIESDSPHRPAASNNAKKMTSEYSFQNDTFKTQFQQNQQLQKHANTIFNQTNMSHQQDESLWDNHKDDSNQFIQRACTKMNLPEFQQLKSEMQKARQELLNLRKKDSELQQRKMNIR